MALSYRKESWLENHGSFLQERIMAGKSWLFPTGKNHGWKIMALSYRKESWLENHGSFLQERIMAGKSTCFRTPTQIQRTDASSRAGPDTYWITFPHCT